MTHARGGRTITSIAVEYPYQVEIRELWGDPRIPLLDLDKAARWVAADGAWCRTSGRVLDHSAPRWAFAEFAAAEAFHARFGGRLVDAGDEFPATLRYRTRRTPLMRDILAGRRTSIG